MGKGLEGADVVMMLRLQKERMGGHIPSEREYFHFYGLDEKTERAKRDVIILHPGPMNRGVEIDGDLADDLTDQRSKNRSRWGFPLEWQL